MPDGIVDHQARDMAKDAARLLASHEALDTERFAQLRDEIADVHKEQSDIKATMDGAFRSLNQKMDDVKDRIGSRPTWVVSMLISFLLALVGFLTARAFPL